jgi:hypothetical protein
MSARQQIVNSKVSTRQMKEAIHQSGYPLEQRVELVMREAFGYVETNLVFRDPDTDKSREIDIRALRIIPLYRKKSEADFIFPMLLCECENNSQPIVFFTSEPLVPVLHCDDLRVSGIPAKFWNGNYKWFESLADFTEMAKFHHYCKGKIATQYCTFQLKKDKSSWLAFHSEEQHDTFNSLIRAVDYEVDSHFNDWSLPDQIDEEYVNIQIYYPLLILQGDLYSAYLEDNCLMLKKAKHIQFRKQFFSSYTKGVETYQIDVIVEDYLSHYLEIIKSEIEEIKNVLQRKKIRVFKSIEKIVEEAKKSGKEADSYRKYLEY